ncbi:uncharacterized protein LOC126897984 isoform X1 [Daktulosphaira vitifoliae]|uniref:uncharacterized protein LOC126897984 isoform X1 n=1 Tax=Daktulosphaira vitifoliae TaxID=58002 RepID=UPI0021AA48CA|nr:uncharacterized protein LOC126897984 isoform X1 [Daktulosphaira vitifoliae]
MYSLTTTFEEYFEGEQKKYPQLKLEDIYKLKESIDNETQLPPISDKKLIAFLQCTNFNLEEAKITIINCYKCYLKIPDVFCSLDPLSPEMKKLYKSSSFGDLTLKYSGKGECIVYWQFKDPDIKLYDCLSSIKLFHMWLEYKLLHCGTFDGLVIVVNTSGLSWRHVIKIPITIMGEFFVYIQRGIPIQIKSFHFINSGNAISMLFKMLTPFIDKELMEKIKFYPVDSEEIFNYIAKNILPIEAGGSGKSHTFFCDETYKNIATCTDILKKGNEELQKHLFINNEEYMD